MNREGEHMGDDKKGLVDFTRARQVRFEVVLGELGLLDQLTAQGEERGGRCPIPSHGGEGTKPTFYVNVAKQVFQCFSCKKKGNVLDFAALMRGKGIRDAGAWLVSLREHGEERNDQAVEGVREGEERDAGRDLSEKVATALEEIFCDLIGQHGDNPRALAGVLARFFVGVKG